MGPMKVLWLFDQTNQSLQYAMVYLVKPFSETLHALSIPDKEHGHYLEKALFPLNDLAFHRYLS
ncbi:uncharacterized protein METZ01_LOCUS457263 [marine metagenome]|uniref:Uncharacterized protein n=1 Tax=marine metagenome TaxID=408172 RepID=A0A383AA31_9ZZZZ